MEAIKEHKSLSELAEQFELLPNLISIWKREFLENAANVFSKENEYIGLFKMPKRKRESFSNK